MRVTMKLELSTTELSYLMAMVAFDSKLKYT